VRSFAHALGEITGAGACLKTLRRTRSGEFGLAVAMSMESLQDASRVGAALVGLDRLLARFPALTLTDSGRVRASHGRDLGPADCEPGEATPASSLPPTSAAGEWVRLFDRTGALVAMATAGETPGSLHPSVVLI
jgi:tRNA pseudouridine55 synthase